MKEKNTQNAVVPTKDTRQYKDIPKTPKRFISRIFALVACFMLMTIFTITSFADSSSVAPNQLVPDIFVPDTVLVEVAHANANRTFTGAITVQKSLAPDSDITTGITYTGTTYNVVPASIGSGTYPSAYASYYYPDGNGAVSGYNGICRTSSGNSPDGSTEGVKYTYNPFVFYPSSLTTPAIYDVVFSGEQVTEETRCEFIAIITYVDNDTGEITTKRGGYYKDLFSNSGSQNEYFHYRTDASEVVKYLFLPDDYPLRVLSLTIYAIPVDNYGTESEPSYEPTPARYRWTDFIFNYQPYGYIPPDATDSVVKVQQVVNSGSASSFTEFLSDTVGGFFGTTLFHFGYVNVTIGAIISVFGAVSILLWLLKLFLGG